jgi:hypothetical protein
MSFDRHLRQLAQNANLKVADADHRRAMMKFETKTGTKTLWIIPYDDMWEFSAQSAIKFPQLADCPQWIAVVVLSINAKNKRAFWCIEKIRGEHVMSAMLNFPASALTPALFHDICWDIVREVAKFEMAVYEQLKGGGPGGGGPAPSGPPPKW